MVVWFQIEQDWKDFQSLKAVVTDAVAYVVTVLAPLTAAVSIQQLSFWALDYQVKNT